MKAYRVMKVWLQSFLISLNADEWPASHLYRFSLSFHGIGGRGGGKNRSGRFGELKNIFPPTGIRTLDRPARRPVTIATELSLLQPSMVWYWNKELYNGLNRVVTKSINLNAVFVGDVSKSGRPSMSEIQALPVTSLCWKFVTNLESRNAAGAGVYGAHSNVSLKELVEGLSESGGNKLRTDNAMKRTDDAILIHSFRQDTCWRIRHAKGEDDKRVDTAANGISQIK